MDKGVVLTFANWLLAFLPIFVLLMTILLFKWGAPKSGAISWFVAVIIGIFAFGADTRLLALANSKGLSLSLYVLLIIWGAVFLYNMVEKIGAVKVIGDTMTKITEDRLLQCLLMAWCFASFMQGIAGFGVPVAVVAPIMVVMGFSPAVAAATCLVGHSWSISFGSMGSSYYTIQLVTKIPGEIIGPWMAVLFTVPIFATGFAVAHIYGGLSAVKRGAPAIIVTSVVMAFMCWLMNRIGAAQLATLIPALCGCGTIAAMARTGFYRSDLTVEELAHQNAPKSMGFHLAFAPYYILILLSILSQIKDIAKIFAPYTWGLDYPAIQTAFGFVVKAEKMYSRINVLTHPAPLLLAAAILGYLVFKSAGKWKPGAAIDALKSTFTQCVPTSIGIITMVMMALIMNDTGMTNLLAQGMAKATGILFPIFSPFIGVLGAFLTGSNTNSNVMFGALQVETAKVLGISTVIMAAVQSVGGSVGCSIAPSKVLIGTATVGLDGRESEVMYRTIPYCAVIALLVGINAWLFAYVFFRSLP
ncbi:L-lactate permease [Thermosinus carboxydivorans Nor1]|uniref:L-lactate permease n=1 Tax=Thermosinus carboxydivorans Nor1 TaxID=401526 RepID=A1HPK6_9FIRM|nr:L-lactate permease [Thermosinus carboxydivorans]EAX47978.1 L-lactate permease [Thermosinus carboxydivorans Nor1]